MGLIGYRYDMEPDLFAKSSVGRPGSGLRLRAGATDPSAGPFGPRTPYMIRQVTSGTWREACISAGDAGLNRDLPVFLADRKTSPILHEWHGDGRTHCPPLYWDLAIGSGPCGLGCRGCYLLGTFRERRDPHQPLIYDNVAFLWDAARRWLLAPGRRAMHTLGLGTDRSDSLLFEGILGHARHLIPMFADPARNPSGAKLLLLTKTANAHYLAGLPTANIIVSFSLNPELIADLWEGKWPDTMERITPSIEARLNASFEAQRMGFEIRWRIDPILTPDGWGGHYCEFLARAAAAGHRPIWITLGTYRESTPELQRWRRYWRLPPMEWTPEPLRRDGTHWHSPAAHRIAAYVEVARLCRELFPSAGVSLCKETTEVRAATGLCSPGCNCVGSLSTTACGAPCAAPSHPTKESNERRT